MTLKLLLSLVVLFIASGIATASTAPPSSSHSSDMRAPLTKRVHWIAHGLFVGSACGLVIAIILFVWSFSTNSSLLEK